MQGRTQKRWLERAGLLAILMTALLDSSALVPGSSAPQPAVKPSPRPYRSVPATDELYQRFREYRLALADASANVSPFFSRKYLEWNIGSLLNKRSSMGAERDNRVFRARMRVGTRATVVHAISVRDERGGGRTLKLRISTGDAKDIYSFEVTYVQEQEVLRISKWGVDSTMPHETGDEAIVERFADAPE